MTKTNQGNFFEDFRLGQTIRHATPRTVTTGDVALYNGLFGARFAVQSSDAFASAIGYPRAPVDDLLVFHVVFGKTVPDISLNAVANLGYANCRFLAPVYPGDTLTATSEVIGLKENSSRKTGIVFVRSAGFKQDGTLVLEYVRWVMVRKRDENAPSPADHVPRLPTEIEAKLLGDACPPIKTEAYDNVLAGSRYRYADYAVGEKIDHSRRHDGRGSRASDRDAALSEQRAHSLQSIHRRQGPLRPPADLWRTCDFAGARACRSTASATPFISRGSMAGGMWRRYSRAIPCSPGRKCWPKRSCRSATMSARSGCARSPPKISPAAISPTNPARTDDPSVILDLDYWVLIPR